MECKDAKEDLEPLFDYSRVQPKQVFYFDDTDLDASPIFIHCRKEKKASKAAESDQNQKKTTATANVDADGQSVVEEDEDWLIPPPPKSSHGSDVPKDKYLQELRIQKQELVSVAQSAQEILTAVVEVAKQEVGAKKSTEKITLDDDLCGKPRRQKITVVVQDKNGQKHLRLFKDDTFTKLAKLYARTVNADPDDLVFTFDGDRVGLSQTPEGLGLEDGDMIEVHVKPR